MILPNGQEVIFAISDLKLMGGGIRSGGAAERPGETGAVWLHEGIDNADEDVYRIFIRGGLPRIQMYAIDKQTYIDPVTLREVGKFDSILDGRPPSLDSADEWETWKTAKGVKANKPIPRPIWIRTMEEFDRWEEVNRGRTNG